MLLESAEDGLQPYDTLFIVLQATALSEKIQCLLSPEL